MTPEPILSLFASMQVAIRPHFHFNLLQNPTSGFRNITCFSEEKPGFQEAYGKYGFCTAFIRFYRDVVHIFSTGPNLSPCFKEGCSWVFVFPRMLLPLFKNGHQQDITFTGIFCHRPIPLPGAERQKLPPKPQTPASAAQDASAQCLGCLGMPSL